jgi:hypothetical protein
MQDDELPSPSTYYSPASHSPDYSLFPFSETGNLDYRLSFADQMKTNFPLWGM